MIKVTFRNILEKESEFKEIENNEFLLPTCIAYARTMSKEIYDNILHNKISIYVNNELIPVDDWNLVELEDNDEIIIVPNLEGGVAAIAIGALLIGASKIAIFASISTILMTMGISMALGGISQLLFQPDLPVLNASGSKSTQTYNWQGISSTARNDLPVPVVYGTHMVGGNIISLFTDSEGETNYLYMLIALAEGEIEGICQDIDHTKVCLTSDTTDATYTDPAIKLDDHPFKIYKDVVWWYRTGSNLAGTSYPIDYYYPFEQNKIKEFNGARLQYDDGRTVIHGYGAAGDGIVYTTTKPVDRLNYQIQAPSIYDSSGKDITAAEVQYLVYYKKESDSTYTQWSPNVYTGRVTSTTYVNNPTTYLSFLRYDDSGNKYIYTKKPPIYTIEIDKIYYETKQEWSYGGDFSFDTGIVKITYIDYSVYTEDGDKIIVNTPTSQYPMVYGYSAFGTAAFRDGTSVMELPIFEYVLNLSINVKRGDKFTISSILTTEIVINSIPISGKSKTGVWSSMTIPLKELVGGQDYYTVKFQRVKAPSDDLLIADDIVLNSVTEIVDGEFIYPNTALLGFKIKATEQLSGSPPNVNVIIKGKKILVPDIETAVSGGDDFTFNNCFWNDTTDKWETVSGTQLYWPDETVWRTEFSDNAILCVNDYMTNTRYGIGDYISSSDIYTDSLKSIIKDCHVKYQPHDGSFDYLNWWDSASNADWMKNLSINTSDDTTLTYDRTNRTITFLTTEQPGVTFITNISVPLTIPIRKGCSYAFTINIGAIGHNIKTLNIFGIESNESTVSKKLGTLSNISTTGDHSTYITPTVDTKYLNLKLTSYKLVDVRIDGIAVTISSAIDHYHTFDGVMDGKQSAPSALVEMCDTFRTWISWYDGKFNFIMDKDTTPIQTLSVGDTYSFTQSFTPLSEIPYRLISQFTNEERNFDLTQLVVTAQDTTLTKANERTIGLKGITNRQKAERESKFKLNKATNDTHQINVTCGHNLVHATAGDLINIQDDLPSIGHGGRIIGFDYDTKKIVIDNSYNFTATNLTASYFITYADEQNVSVSVQLDVTATGSTQTLYAKSETATPADYSSFALGLKADYVKPFRIINMVRTNVSDVQFDAIEHHPSLYATEPAITVVNDNYSQLPKVTKAPKPLVSVTVTPVRPSEGIGFTISSRLRKDDMVSRDIVVQMSDANDGFYETIGVIPCSIQKSITYIDNNLNLNHTYYFKIFARSQFLTGPASYMQCFLNKSNYIPVAPKGIYIKGADKNEVDTLNYHIYDGKDINLVWNPVGINYDQMLMITGYSIAVYKGSNVSGDSQKPWLTSAPINIYEVANSEFKYTYEMQLSDLGSTLNPRLIFRISTLNKFAESNKPAIFKTVNEAPLAPTIVGESLEDGVKFYINVSETNDIPDFLQYKYRTRTDPPDDLTQDGTMEAFESNRWICPAYPNFISKSSVKRYGGLYSLRYAHSGNSDKVYIYNSYSKTETDKVFIDIMTKQSHVYNFSAAVYTEETAIGSPIKLNIIYCDYNKNILWKTRTTVAESTVTSNWEVINGTFTIPEYNSFSIRKCYVILEIEINDYTIGVNTYIDYVSIYEYWSDWISTKNNILRRNLNTNEMIAQENNRSRIHIEAQIVDVYKQESTTATSSVECINDKFVFTVHPTEGIGHFQYIQDAINKVPDGSTIILKEGTYDLSLEVSLDNYATGVYLLDKNLDIEGSNRNKVIIQNNYGDSHFRIINKEKTYNLSNFKLSSVCATIDLVKIEGNSAVPNLDITLKNIVFDENFNSNGVAIYSCNGNILIDNNIFKCDATVADGANAVIVNTGQNIQITNNSGRGHIKGFADITLSEDIDIQNNTSKFIINGIYTSYNTSALNIYNNKLYQATYTEGYDVRGIKSFDQSSDSVAIENNTIIIKNSKNTPPKSIIGISMASIEGVNVKGNKVTVESTTATGNVYGISVSGTSGTAPMSNNTVIINCNATPPNTATKKIGMLVTADNLSITNNVINMTNSATNEYGFYVNGDNNLISGNKIYNVLAGKKIKDVKMSNAIYGNTEDDGSVVNTEYNATYSILRVDELNRPTALTVNPSNLIGRKATGGIVSLTATDIANITGVSDSKMFYYTVHPATDVGDFRYIQEAVNEVPDGSVIILLNATYDLSLEATIENYASGLYISGKSLGIYGENRNKVVIVGVAEHAVMTINDYNNNSYAIKNISVIPDDENYYYSIKVGGNLTLDIEENNIYSYDNVNSIYIGCDATVPVNSNITISNNKFKNLDSSSESVSNGIYSTLHNNLNINNNIFNNYMEESIKVYYSKNVSINSNLIDGFVKTGIYCGKCTNINIDNNKLVQSTALYSDYGFNALPIMSSLSENVIISNNIIDANSNARINAINYVSTHYTYWYKGIASYNNKNIDINNNIISLNLPEYKGIVTGVWSNTDSRGIKITNNTININCTIVEDNSKQGIHLYDVTNALVSNNIIDMNNSATNEYGVYITGDDNSIYGNKIYNVLAGKKIKEV